MNAWIETFEAFIYLRVFFVTWKQLHHAKNLDLFYSLNIKYLITPMRAFKYLAFLPKQNALINVVDVRIHIRPLHMIRKHLASDYEIL